jgi:hypothetical protein
MRGARRRAGRRSAHPSTTAASRAAAEMAAVRQPFVSLRADAALPCTEGAVRFCRRVVGELPYGPVALTVLGGPIEALPYGPLALTVLGGPIEALPYWPLAFTVLGGPVEALPYGPLALDVFVAHDAPAGAGIARHSVQALMAMRRVSMVTSRGLEKTGLCICRRGDDAPTSGLGMSQRRAVATPLSHRDHERLRALRDALLLGRLRQILGRRFRGRFADSVVRASRQDTGAQREAANRGGVTTALRAGDAKRFHDSSGV